MKKELIENIDFYYSEDGTYKIFTKQYHLDRGYCCNNRCVNCPFKIKYIQKKKSDSNG
jgi:hypothetical protein